MALDVKVDRRTATGPVSYAADGLPVDLSAAYSNIYAIQVVRVHTTSGNDKVPAGFLVQPCEKGTDLYASGKFRLQFRHAPGHTHAPTSDADVLKATGTVANAGNVPDSSVTHAKGSCVVGCDADCVKTIGTLTNRTDVIRGSGATKVAALTAVDAIAAAALAEVAATTDLSTFTVEYLVWGVPV